MTKLENLKQTLSTAVAQNEIDKDRSTDAVITLDGENQSRKQKEPTSFRSYSNCRGEILDLTKDEFETITELFQLLRSQNTAISESQEKVEMFEPIESIQNSKLEINCEAKNAKLE